MKVKRWALVVLNRIALTIFLYASFLYFLKRIVFVKRHVWFFRIYETPTPRGSITHILFADEIGTTPDEAVMNQVTM